MKKIYAYVFTSFASVLAISVPSISSAACADGSTGVICNPLKNVSDIPSLVKTIMGYVVQIGGVIAIFAFIYAGYKFVEAQGKPEELKKAKDIFFYTCIGVAILLGAQVIASLVVGTINNIQK